MTEKEIKATLKKTKMAFNLTGIPIIEMLQYLQKQTGVKVTLDPSLHEVGVERMTLTIPAEANLNAEDVLKWITSAHDLTWKVEDGEVFVTSK